MTITHTFRSVNESALIDAAIAYAQAGFEVFPLRPNSKLPLEGSSWTSLSTCDPERVRYLWEHYGADCNVGWHIGDRFMVADLDCKDGKDGWRSWTALTGSTESPWPMQRTPTGGFHVVLPKQPGVRILRDKGEHGGIDLQTDNAYVVLAPSVTPTGDYQWIIDGRLDAAVPDALTRQLRQWSTQRARVAVQLGDVEQAEMDRVVESLPERMQRFLRDGESWKPDGDRSSCAFGVAEYLTRIGTEEKVVARILLSSAAGVDMAPEHRRWGNSDDWLIQHIIGPGIAEGRAARDALFEPVEKESPEVESGLNYHGAAVSPDGHGRGQMEESFPISNVAPHESLVQRASELTPENLKATVDLLGELALAALEPAYYETVLAAIAEHSGLTKGVLRQQYSLAQQRIQTTRAQERQRRQTDAGETPSHIFDLSQDKIFAVQPEVWMSRQAFLTDAARRHGGDRSAAETQLLTGTNAEIPTVLQTTWDPGLPPGIVDLGNGPLWNRWQVGPLWNAPAIHDGGEGPVRPWLDILDGLELEEPGITRNYLLDWMAFLIQNPGVKINTGIMLGGTTGIGKDSLISPLVTALGDYPNVKQPQGASLLKNFNSWASCSKLVVIQELSLGNHKDAQHLYEQLKPLLTDPPTRFEIDEKNLRPVWIANKIQIWAMTNHHHPLHMDADDRRWFCAWCERELPPLGTEARERIEDQFAEYYSWLEHGGAVAVVQWLKGRKLGHFNPKAQSPSTAWRENMIETSANPLTAWIRRCIADQIVPFNLPVMNIEMLLAAANAAYAAGVLRYAATERGLHVALAEAGVLNKRKATRYTPAGQPSDRRRFYFPVREHAGEMMEKSGGDLYLICRGYQESANPGNAARETARLKLIDSGGQVVKKAEMPPWF